MVWKGGLENGVERWFREWCGKVVKELCRKMVQRMVCKGGSENDVKAGLYNCVESCIEIGMERWSR